MHWREALNKDSQAFQTFTARLEVLRRDAQRAMDEAPSFEGVLEARGKKKVLDQLLSELTMDSREAALYERTFGNARATKSA